MEMSNTSGGRGSNRLSPSKLRAVHDLFVTGQLDLDSVPLRRVVAESWRRSLATGVDPDLGGGTEPAVSVALDRMRSSHPLAPALPVIRRLLVDDASDAGVVVAVTAADGTLLWVEGDRAACRKAERMNFVPGADWSERGAGTNAPGTALALEVGDESPCRSGMAVRTPAVPPPFVVSSRCRLSRWRNGFRTCVPRRRARRRR